MNNESAQTIKTHRFPRHRRVCENNMTNQNPASSTDGRTGATKRKASPDRTPTRKRTKRRDRSQEDLRIKVLRRTVREFGEGPTARIWRRGRRRLDLSLVDNETASCSTATGTESSNSSSSNGKAAPHGEEAKRKRKRSADREDVKQQKKQKTTQDVPLDARAEFEAKYRQQDQLGEGGCGSVFAGFRKADNLPVAIKRVPKDNVLCMQADNNGKKVSVEVAIMQKICNGTAGSVGTSAPVSLLDWYDLGEELILVMERPVPCTDLFNYTEDSGGSLKEEEAKIILKQLVDAAIDLEDQQIFHRDIKPGNILIETGTGVPRVRIIDFGLSCFSKKKSFFRTFHGTSAYTPPEWYRRHTYRPGPTTVWQLGVVLFHSLHKCVQFRTTRFIKNKQKISNKLSEDCQDFLQKCLTKEPEQRPTLEELQHHQWLR